MVFPQPEMVIDHHMNLPHPIKLSSDDDFALWVPYFKNQTEIAIDTESNSMYAYRGRVCLIQLSTREHDFLLDPFVLQDLTPIGEILASPTIEKVFHAAEYDLILFQREFGFHCVNLFDTMLGAKICGFQQVGLDKLLAHYLDVTVSKSHQLADWGVRPLDEEQLAYAQADTHFLLALRDQIKHDLEERNALDEAQEIFVYQTEHIPMKPVFDPDGFWAIGKSASLDRQQLAILRELVVLREQIAEQRDLPPARMLPNKVLIQLAQQAPKHQQVLFRMRGFPKTLARRNGEEIIAAIKHGKTAQLPPRPRNRKPPAEVAERYNLLRKWRKNKAEQRGVDSNVILPKEVLWDLAKQLPMNAGDLEAIDGFGSWRQGEYGEELLDILRNSVSPVVTREELD